MLSLDVASLFCWSKRWTLYANVGIHVNKLKRLILRCTGYTVSVWWEVLLTEGGSIRGVAAWTRSCGHVRGQTVTDRCRTYLVKRCVPDIWMMRSSFAIPRDLNRLLRAFNIAHPPTKFTIGLGNDYFVGFPEVNLRWMRNSHRKKRKMPLTGTIHTLL